MKNKPCSVCGVPRVVMIKAQIQERTDRQLTFDWLCIKCLLEQLLGLLVDNKAIAKQEKYKELMKPME